MRNFGSLRNWISVVALTIFILTGSASLSAQTAQNTGSDVQYHKFVPVVPPESSSFSAASTDAAQVNAAIGQQIQLIMQEKYARTPAQQKIDSNVLYTIRMMRGQQAAPGITSLYTGVDLDQKDRIAVDIVANVTDALLEQMASAGALVLSSLKDYRAIRALVPPDQIEALAASPDVSFIGPRVGSITSRLKFSPPAHAAAKGALAPGFDERAARVRKQIAAYLQQRAGTNSGGTPGVPVTGQGSVTSEGDATHQAATARGVYGVSGVGLKIGVLSDSANSKGTVTAAQATGDLPPTCPGPGGPCYTSVQDIAGGSDEGAAMLEIVYDLVPGASLYFATANIDEATFASNIKALQTAGCNIIVDDVFYFDEPVFQDGIVAQAVTTVTNAGAMYFSSAGNEGNVAAGTSGYFEGDFNDAGSPGFTFPGGTKTGTIHNFGTVGSPINGDIITGTTLGEQYTLNWADPQGASTNDYDLFLVSSTGTVRAMSTNVQPIATNPFESIVPPSLQAGDRLVVFKTTGAASVAFAIKTIRGTLTQVTTGETWGHSAIVAAFSVAATPAAAAGGASANGPFPNPFTTANQAETFSSDGPRRMFFNPDGSAITPGNLRFGTNGGAVRTKPDITAADGVHTSLPSGELNPFYGTSAAAPHAASVAALIMSAKPSLTPAQIRTTLTSTALDIGPAGIDNVSGNGIVMALAALNSLGISGFADLEFGTITATENPGNGNGIIEAGEGGLLVIQLKNTNGVQDAKNITAVLTSTTPGVTVTLPGSSAYPNLPLGTGIGTNVTPFTFTLANNLSCGTPITFTLTLTYTNGPAATKVLTFLLPNTLTISHNLGAVAPSGLPSGITFATGTQTDRISRTGTASACGTAKANPGVFGDGQPRVFDSYTFTNFTGAAACLTATLSAANAPNLLEAAYNSAGFAPATPSLNYAADSGGFTSPQTFGVTVAAAAATTIVVSDVNVAPGSNSPYTLQLPACLLTNPATANHPPIAVAQNVTVTAATLGGTAAANINNGSSDPDGDALTITQSPAGPYSIGVTSVLLTVTDTKGAAAQATANVTVLNPPTITLLSPTTVAAGSGAFTLTVTGTNFVSGSVVNFNGAAKATSFQNSTQVSATVLSTDVTTAGTPSVTVTVPGAVTSNSTTFTISGAPTPDLNIQMSHVGNFFQGQTGANYTITAGNVGLGATTGTVTVVDTLPAGLSATTMSGTGWTCTVGTLTCTRADALAASTNYPAITLTVNVATTTAPSVTNSATVSGGGETNLANDSVTDLTNVLPPDLNIQMSHVGNFSQGQTGATYTITAGNVGSGITSGTVTVVDTLPAGLTATAMSGTGWVCTFATATCTTTNALAGGSNYPAITLTVNVAANAGTPLNNLATVSGGNEINVANDSVTDSTLVTASNPVPTVTTLSPTSVAAGSIAFTLTVNGTNFVSNSVIHFNGQVQATTFVSSTQLTTTVQSLEVDIAGNAPVFVNNPTPGGGSSNSVNFTISSTSNPVPAITSISPNTVGAGSPTFTMTVNGSNFVSTSVVDLNGSPQATSFVSSTQLTATITASEILNSGSANIIVVNPTPGGGVSNTSLLVITTPVATLTTLAPSSAIAGGPAFTLTVNGSNFENTAVVQWNGSNRTTSFVNATQLTASITAADIASVGTATVIVFNPVGSGSFGPVRTQGVPSGTFSNPLTFTINAANPVPTITSISPTNTSAGSGAFALTVNGTKYISSSVVQWNGSPRTTTFVSATQLTASITAADILTANISQVSVVNPTPGGGTSNVVQFTATTPIPVITSLAPNTAVAGSAAFNMAVNGSNFINTSVVQWKGSNRATTFVSSTQLMAAVTAADIAAVGTASVDVFTPTVFFGGAQPLGGPSGITSNALTFTITAPNPVPTLTAISPTSTGAGGAGFTMTLTGTNFISTSVAQWKGSARVTTFVSATQLTAAITAADIASAGTAAITVFTPTPGGGTTAALTFTITDFSVTPTPATQTVAAGASTTYSIAAAAVGGAFAGNVTFTASGFPTGSGGTFNPASVAPGSSTSFTVTTTARSSSQTGPPPSGPVGPVRPLWLVAFLLTFVLASFSIAKFGGRRLRRLIPIGAFALLLISAGYLSGCASSGFPKVNTNTGTPAGTYLITVTGTSGTNVHTTTVTLVVQ